MPLTTAAEFARVSVVPEMVMPGPLAERVWSAMLRIGGACVLVCLTAVNVELPMLRAGAGAFVLAWFG